MLSPSLFPRSKWSFIVWPRASNYLRNSVYNTSRFLCGFSSPLWVSLRRSTFLTAYSLSSIFHWLVLELENRSLGWSFRGNCWWKSCSASALLKHNTDILSRCSTRDELKYHNFKTQGDMIWRQKLWHARFRQGIVLITFKWDNK